MPNKTDHNDQVYCPYDSEKLFGIKQLDATRKGNVRP